MIFFSFITYLELDKTYARKLHYSVGDVLTCHFRVVLTQARPKIGAMPYTYRAEFLRTARPTSVSYPHGPKYFVPCHALSRAMTHSQMARPKS